jgi:hypothetical protein
VTGGTLAYLQDAAGKILHHSIPESLSCSLPDTVNNNQIGSQLSQKTAASPHKEITFVSLLGRGKSVGGMLAINQI